MASVASLIHFNSAFLLVYSPVSRAQLLRRLEAKTLILLSFVVPNPSKN